MQPIMAIGTIVCVTVMFMMLSSLTAAEIYYVTPIPNTLCPEEGVPCFTLSEYATKPSDYFASNTTLILLPGNHSLDSVLWITNITSLSIMVCNLTVAIGTINGLIFLCQHHCC